MNSETRTFVYVCVYFCPSLCVCAFLSMSAFVHVCACLCVSICVRVCASRYKECPQAVVVVHELLAAI